MRVRARFARGKKKEKSSHHMVTAGGRRRSRTSHNDPPPPKPTPPPLTHPFKTMHSRFPTVITPPSSTATTTTTDAKTGGGGRLPSSPLARRSYPSLSTTRMSDLVGSKSPLTRSHLQGAGELPTIPASRAAPPPLPPPLPPPPLSPLREGGVSGSGASASSSVSANSTTTSRRRLSRASTAPAAESAGRRNSLLSEYNLREALRSKTEQVLSPAVSSADGSPWHNVPLAFAVLPAVGGVLFKGGNYFVTDVILLLLAAVFLHWLVKFPWSTPPPPFPSPFVRLSKLLTRGLF